MDNKYLYILLTDTKTRFSKVSKWITRDPYNHVSLSFDADLKAFYTYALVQDNGYKGGFKVETRKDLIGANYQLYAVKVTKEAFARIQHHVGYLTAHTGDTRYRHLGLVNSILKKNVFGNASDREYICSEFVIEVLRMAEVDLFTDRAASTVRPNDLLEENKLIFIQEGKL